MKPFCVGGTKVSHMTHHFNDVISVCVSGTMMSRNLKDEEHMMSKFKDERMDRLESERDSGFSGLDSFFCVDVVCLMNPSDVSHRLSRVCVCVLTDASSEHLSAVDQTDADDTLCSVGSAGTSSRSQPSQLAAVVGGGALQGLSPMIIMNNVVLKQVNFKTSSFCFACFMFLFYSDDTVMFALMLSTRCLHAK